MKVDGSVIEKIKKINSKNQKLDNIQKLCLYVFIFLLGSLIGFIYEELFYLIADHELVYRGFLYGPYIPVYGFGAILMLPVLRKYKKNPLVVFLGGMLLTGIVEYFTGWLMWVLYHKRWWDYTGLFLNINGYVCLRSVLTFAIGGLGLIYIADPLMRNFVKKKDKTNLCFSSVIIVAIFLIDLMLTLIFRNAL